jgi:predicted site-specific integrase-resolvase
MLTKKELATEIKVSLITIERYMKKGMPYFKTPTGRVRFILEDVTKWLKGE